MLYIIVKTQNRNHANLIVRELREKSSSSAADFVVDATDPLLNGHMFIVVGNRVDLNNSGLA